MHRRTLTCRRGVSLVEAALVLGIIGTAVGALFALGGAANQRANLNIASVQLDQISQNMRNIFAGQNTSYASLGPLNADATSAGNDFNVTTNFMQRFAFPNDMIVPDTAAGVQPCVGAVANNIFSTQKGTCDGTARTGSGQIALAGSAAAGVQYVIRYTNIDADTCNDLLIHNSLPGHDTGLVRVRVNEADAGISGSQALPLPIRTVAANNACTNATANIIDWYYQL